MSLTKIRFANKKHKRAVRRKKRQAIVRSHNERAGLAYKKSRKAIVQARREQLQRRDVELDYVSQLKEEVLSE